MDDLEALIKQQQELAENMASMGDNILKNLYFPKIE
jgi:hypothetical protein